MLQVEKISEISKKAKKAHELISQTTGVGLHSEQGIKKRINEILKGKESFMSYSRTLAMRAQHSESRTKHEKERLSGTKGTITIKNYLGNYYFTADEINFKGSRVYLVEGKNTKNDHLPSLEDI